MNETPIQRVRRLCLALPEAVEKEAWGAPTFRAGPKGKIFAIYSDDHHDDGRLALWCPAPVGEQAVLVTSEPQRYFKPPYVGPKGWLGVLFSLLSDDELEAHLRTAFSLVATRRLLARLEGS